MSNAYEKARTKWKHSSSCRLRRCINCEQLFPSAGPDERRCPKCAKSMEDARARAYAPNPEAELKEFLDEHFDPEMVERRKREEKHDSERRIRRRDGWE